MCIFIFPEPTATKSANNEMWGGISIVHSIIPFIVFTRCIFVCVYMFLFFFPNKNIIVNIGADMGVGQVGSNKLVAYFCVSFVPV